MARQLAALGLVSTIDHAVLGAYCDAYVRWLRATGRNAGCAATHPWSKSCADGESAFTYCRSGRYSDEKVRRRVWVVSRGENENAGRPRAGASALLAHVCGRARDGRAWRRPGRSDSQRPYGIYQHRSRTNEARGASRRSRGPCLQSRTRLITPIHDSVDTAYSSAPPRAVRAAPFASLFAEQILRSHRCAAIV
jgi:hypothetical protein